MGWRDQALCQGTDLDLWFPVKSTPCEAVVTARAMCWRCPVREACLEDTLAVEGSAPASRRHGIFGGLDGAERYALAVERNPRLGRGDSERRRFPRRPSGQVVRSTD